MLILHRRKHQSVIIDHVIEVIVLGNSEGRVKLGVNAPQTMAIDRREAWEKKQGKAFDFYQED